MVVATAPRNGEECTEPCRKEGDSPSCASAAARLCALDLMSGVAGRERWFGGLPAGPPDEGVHMVRTPGRDARPFNTYRRRRQPRRAQQVAGARAIQPRRLRRRACCRVCCWPHPAGGRLWGRRLHASGAHAPPARPLACGWSMRIPLALGGVGRHARHLSSGGLLSTLPGSTPNCGHLVGTRPLPRPPHDSGSPQRHPHT